MDTKLKGDIAEQAVVLQALKRGWGVLRPVGDRGPQLNRCPIPSDRHHPHNCDRANFPTHSKFLAPPP
jgi:hypothetical protein